MAVNVMATPEFRTRALKPLFKANTTEWEVSGDGTRFLVPVQVGERTPAPITVVLNLETTLKK